MRTMFRIVLAGVLAAGVQGVAWAETSPQEIAALVAQARQLETQGAAAQRRALLVQVEQKLLTDTPTIQAVKPEAWAVFTSVLAREMALERRAAWVLGATPDNGLPSHRDEETSNIEG